MLQALCTELHEKIIAIDEERYNLERKANMVVDEVSFQKCFLNE